MRRWIAKASNLLRPGRAEREMEREIASHLAILQEDLERRGMLPGEAGLAAKRMYGGVEQAKELHREERTFPRFQQTLKDLRYASRALARNPGFTLVAVVTLALGIGVNTTLFSIYNAVALKPLPVAQPDRVVRFERWFASGSRGSVQYAFSYPEYVYCRERGREFADVVAVSWPVRVNSIAQPVEIELVSDNYFSVLGIVPPLGRTFGAREGAPVAVMSYQTWRRQYQSDPGILGKTVLLNGTAFTVVGVAPESFTGTLDIPQPPAFWAPFWMQSQLTPTQGPRQNLVQLLARLGPSISVKRAQAETDALIRQFGEANPQPDRTTAVTLMRTSLFGNTDDVRFQAFVAALMLVVGMVLLVACANLANMLLARGAGRQREIAIRLALGAGRGRVVRQLLAESILLALLGGAAGLAVSVWSGKVLWVSIARILDPVNSGSMQLDLSPDLRTLGYGLALSLLTGIVFGLSPALRSTRSDLTADLKDEGTSFGRRLSRSRLRNLLIAGQVAVSMALLITTGLLVRGQARSQFAGTGFETRRLFLLAGVSDPGRIVEKMNTLPEVKSASVGGWPLMGTWTPPIVAGSRSGSTLAGPASEGYFETLGIPLVRGRTFTRQEAVRQAPVSVISEAAARRFWPDEDPLGKRFTLDLNFRGKFAEFEVIGIVRDVRFANLTRIDPAHVYVNTGQGSGGALVQVQGDTQRALAVVRETVRSISPSGAPGLELISLEDGPVRMQRLLAQTSAAFASVLASIALLLSGVGIYGVMAYLVSQRTREIGIRMALGASPKTVLKAELLAGMRPVLFGMLLGLAIAGGLSYALHATLIFPGSADFFYGVPFYDPPVFAGLSAFLVLVAALASAVPARRALRVDPMTALRHD